MGPTGVRGSAPLSRNPPEEEIHGSRNSATPAAPAA